MADNGIVGDEITLLAQGSQCIFDYTTTDADMRNASSIEIITRAVNDVSGLFIYATDGTNRVTLTETVSGGLDKNFNFTLRKETETLWQQVSNSSEFSSGVRSLSSLDFSNQIKLQFVVNGISRFAIGHIKWSGIALNRSRTNGTFVSIGNYTSLIINRTTTNVSRATLIAYDYQPSGTNITYYLSNVCNNTLGINFTEVQKGVVHNFQSIGNSICYRAELKSDSNITSPIINKVSVLVVPSSTRNIKADFGGDGDIDWETFNLTKPQLVNGSMSDFNTYRINNCLNTPTCQYPLILGVNGSGILSVDLLNSTQSIVNDLANICGELVLPNITSLDKITYWNWTVIFTNGIINLFDFDIEFKGSKNITLFTHTKVNSSRDLGTQNTSLQIYYSKFNATIPVSSAYNVFPSNKDSKNVTPFGQTENTPIWNISNKAYDLPFDVYSRLNSTLNSCLNVTYSNSSRKHEGSKLNTSYKYIITNISKQTITQERINLTINITMNESWINNSVAIAVGNKIIENGINPNVTIFNKSAPYKILTKDAEFILNYTTGNLTLLNASYNMSYLLMSYNISVEQSWKGIWNFWDLTNCTGRYIIPYVVFDTFCEGCVR